MKKIGKYEYDLEKLLRIEELEILDKIRSPHILKRVEIIESAHHIFIVSQFAEGGTLLEYVSQNDLKSENKLSIYITQLAHGCIEMIRRGIIHRNLNPSSLVICEGIVKMCSFDLSCFGNEKSVFNRKISQLRCSSPQMLMKDPRYSYKCDIWSFGVLCYFMASGGKFPFTLMKNYSEQLETVTKQYEKGIQFSQDFNPELKDLIKGCLQFKEEDRFVWKQVLRHPYFEGIFDEVSEISFGSFMEFSFVFSALRRTSIENKIDINELLKEMEENITVEEFVQKFLPLNTHLNRLELEEVFDEIVKGQKLMKKSRLIDQFEKESVILSKKAIYEKAKVILKEKLEKMHAYLEHIQCDFFCIFRQLDTHRRGKISIDSIEKFFALAGCELLQEEKKIFQSCFELQEGKKLLDWRHFYEPMNNLLNL